MKKLFLAFLLFFLASRTPGQVAGGLIQGTVKDPTGALIAEARVSVTNTDTGIARETSTNAAGSYSVPNLVPGRYAISAAAPGFADRVVSDVTLTVGEQKIVDLTLTVKTQTQQVTVSEVVPAVDTAGDIERRGEL